MDWAYFVFGIITYQLIKMFGLAISHALKERRERRFLKLVNIQFPDNKNISFIALDTSDKRTMAKLEKELRDRYDLDQEDPPVRYHDFSKRPRDR